MRHRDQVAQDLAPQSRGPAAHDRVECPTVLTYTIGPRTPVFARPGFFFLSLFLLALVLSFVALFHDTLIFIYFCLLVLSVSIVSFSLKFS